ncbi:unnamed protein product [Penicillium manginii]
MPPYSTSQKQAIAQFVNLTNSKDSVASKSLRATGWNVERAVDAFFAGTAGPSKSTKFLNEVFDSYRGKSTSNQKSNFTLLILVPSR